MIEKLLDVNIEDLEPHKNNKKYYKPINGDLWTIFVNDIAERGIAERLIVMPHSEAKNKYIIVSGENRYRAAEHLGFQTVPCIVRIYETEEEAEEDLIRINNVRRRPPSLMEQYRNFTKMYELIENRQGKGGGNYSQSDKERTSVENQQKFEHPRDLICNALGMTTNDYAMFKLLSTLPEDIQNKMMNWAENTNPTKKKLKYELDKYKSKYKETKKELSELKDLKGKKDDIEQKASAFEEMTRHLSDPQRMHDAECWKKVIDEIHKVMDFLPRSIPVILDTPISDEIKENLATAVNETATMMELYRGELLRHFVIRKYEIVEDPEDDDIITLGR